MRSKARWRPPPASPTASPFAQVCACDGPRSFCCLSKRDVSGTLLAGLFRSFEIVRRIDEGDVGEGLRKIPQQTFCGGIILFPEQPHNVSERKKTRAHPTRAFLPGAQGASVP